MLPRWIFLLPLMLLVLGTFAFSGQAALLDRVNEAFREVYGRTPTVTEWQYWAGRVVRGEKTTYEALTGAMGYHKAQTITAPHLTAVVGASTPAVASFKTNSIYYPSAVNPNFLPDGTMVKSPTNPNIYYLRGGKKSWVLPSIVNRWLGENHFFKHDIITTISDEDLARYPQTSSVNNLYVGKVLQHPIGTQYFIDDKLRKRELTAGVRAALKIPGGNLYPTSAAHLQEFRTGPKLVADRYPGGMVVYTGAWHGGQIWKIKEASDGALRKHLYLSDYLYEADGNPDESHRAAAVGALLDKHARGANIERYPDGWTVGLSGKTYVVQGGALRHIATPELFAALGYKSKYVLTVYPEFLRRYPHGHAIRAFKSLVAPGTVVTSAPQAAPSAATSLLKVRPHIRDLIGQVNTLYIMAYDKDPTAAENQFWVNYLYNGEVNTKADLIAAMERAATTGRKPSLTSRTAALSEETLERHWFPYLFYFVHQSEPSEADKSYWFGRIHDGDRNTIEELGGTLQWIKDNYGATRR